MEPDSTASAQSSELDLKVQELLQTLARVRAKAISETEAYLVELFHLNQGDDEPLVYYSKEFLAEVIDEALDFRNHRKVRMLLARELAEDSVQYVAKKKEEAGRDKEEQIFNEILHRALQFSKEAEKNLSKQLPHMYPMH